MLNILNRECSFPFNKHFRIFTWFRRKRLARRQQKQHMWSYGCVFHHWKRWMLHCQHLQTARKCTNSKKWHYLIDRYFFTFSHLSCIMIESVFLWSWPVKLLIGLCHCSLCFLSGKPRSWKPHTDSKSPDQTAG